MAVLLALSLPARGEIVAPPGACIGTGTWAQSGLTVDSQTAEPSEVVEIPRADSVAWTGEVIGPQPGDERPISGFVALQMPFPLPGVNLGEWGGTGVNVERAGTRSYDLPGLVPAGVVFELYGEHHEGGALFCSGTLLLQIAGGPFDSPVIWAAIVLTLLLAWFLFRTGRVPAGGDGGAGRAVLGALVGLLFGIFLALTLILFGVAPLASPLLLVLAAAFLIVGAVLGATTPLGGGAAAAEASDLGREDPM